MTLEIDHRPGLRPSPRPRTGTALTARRPVTTPVPVRPPAEMRPATAKSAVIVRSLAIRATADRFVIRAYASAGIGAVLLAAAALVMRLGHVPFPSRAGLLLFTLATLGASMTVGGCAIASRRQDGAAK